MSGDSGEDSEVLHTRKVFYVTGRYVDLNSKNSSKPESKVMVEQMYVEELKPTQVKHRWPLLFWHGMSQTAVSWLTTPDGRPGWASYFLRHGYIVYLVDTPERGRSGWLPDSSKLINVSHNYVEKYWTATQETADSWPQAKLLTQWPGSGKLGDPVFDAFMASQVQSRLEYPEAERLARELGGKLLEKIGPAVLVAHSQGGGHAWAIADGKPDLIKGLVALEPLGPPFVTRITSVVHITTGGGSKIDSKKISRPFGLTIHPIAYNPPVDSPSQLSITSISSTAPERSDIILQTEPARKLTNLSQIPTLVVTSEAGYHSYYDHATVAFLKQAGVKVDWLNLPEVGIHGNGHFMFMEKNSDEIAVHIDTWLSKLEATSGLDQDL